MKPNLALSICALLASFACHAAESPSASDTDIEGAIIAACGGPWHGSLSTRSAPGLTTPDKTACLRAVLKKGLLPPFASQVDWYCWAIKNNNPDAIKAMAEAGFDVGVHKIFRIATCTGKGGLASSMEENNLELFKAFFEGGTPPDLALNKKSVLLIAIENGRLDQVKYLLSKGAEVDRVYENKAFLEYSTTKDMTALLEEYGGYEKIPDSAYLQRVFPYYLDHNPLRARNIALGVRKTNAAYGNYLLGLYYESIALKEGSDNALGDKGLALIAFRKAGELGNADALIKVAEAFDSGNVVRANSDLATEFYFLALARNSGVAQARLIERGKLSAPRPKENLSQPSLPTRASEAQQSSDSASIWQAVGDIFGFIASTYLYSQGLQAEQSRANAQTRAAVRSELQTWSEEERQRARYQPKPTYRCTPDSLGMELNCSPR